MGKGASCQKKKEREKYTKNRSAYCILGNGAYSQPNIEEKMKNPHMKNFMKYY